MPQDARPPQPRPDRRSLLAGSAALAASLAGARAARAAPALQVPAAPAQAAGPFALPALPYAPDALAPHVSANTLAFHHGKHHRAYVDKLNELVAGKDLASQTLEQIVRGAAGDEAKATLFNNAAQAWNHDFYWKSMKPGGGGEPAGALLERVNADFGGAQKLREELAAAALAQFGSGWAWLVADSGKLRVVKTPNADNPMLRGQRPLLTIDVWEHAYYLDFQNRRKDYVAAFLEHLVSWDFAASNLGD
jgi:Fe-Mn family superoxide dismutase